MGSSTIGISWAEVDVLKAFALSEDGSNIAISGYAYKNKVSNLYISVYTWSGKSWEPKGKTRDGDIYDGNDVFIQVSTSSEVKIVCMGAVYAGRWKVRVYKLIYVLWEPLGDFIKNDGDNEKLLSLSLSLNGISLLLLVPVLKR